MRRGILLPILTVVLLGSVAEATVVLPLPLERVVRDAPTVLVATARSMRVVDGGPKRLLFTEVTFDGLTILKGRVEGKSVTYRFAGGVGKDRRVVVVGVPRFVKGRRYVLFVNPDDRLCPTVGWWHGLYRLRKDVDSGEEIVCDSRGRAVYGFSGVLPVTRPPAPKSRPMTLTTFSALVRSIVNEQAVEGEVDDEEEEAPDDETSSTEEGR